MKRNLLIGSGDWNWPDWVSVDGNPASGADYIALVPPLPDAVKRQRYDLILASHFIEHITKFEALALLKECYEILTPSGLLTLEQPNLTYCCKIILGEIDPPEGRSREQFGLQGVFGRPDIDPLMGHKWAYSPESLTDLVVEAGFYRENVSILSGKYHESLRDFQLTVFK